MRSSRAKEGSAPPEQRPCNGRPQGPPAQVRKHDVRKDGRQPPPVPPGQRIIAKVASLGATTGARDGDARPKQRPRQARNSSNATSRGSGASPRDPCRMKSTRGRQDRNVAYNQATSSNATNKPGREQHKPSSKASVPNVCVCACVCIARHHHATSCRVDLHRVVSSCVLRGQRQGPLHLSIDPAMVVCKDGQSRCGNTRRGRLEGSRHW